MMPPSLMPLPLLVSALAVGLTCLPAMAKPKAPAQKPAPAVEKAPSRANTPPVAKQAPAGKRTGAPAPVPANRGKKSSPAPVKPAGRQTGGDRSGKVPPAQPVSLIADPAELLARVPASGPLGE